jgi:hypothetical protein
MRKKLAALALVVVGFGASSVVGLTHAHAAVACVSASAEVSVNGSDVVNQSVDQCTPA